MLKGQFFKTTCGFGARSHAQNFSHFFLSPQGTRWWQWVSSRSIGGASANSFTALNLAYYLIECYTEVRRTPGMVLSFNENRRFPKNATIKAFDRFTRPLFANWQKTQHRVLIVTSNRKLHLMMTANLCKYFVSIHGQHKICGIRDASSSSFSRSSLI